MIYLDHAATTPLDGQVLEAMRPYLTRVFANPSSQHSAGREAAHAVLSARDEIANIMGVKSSEIYFVSSGTEAANTAIKGVCAANRDRGRHIVLSAMEHPCLTESAADLKRQGYEVQLVYPEANGIVDARKFGEAIREDTVFAACMSANNEVGTLQPIREIYAVCKEKGVFFYCDCVQTAGVLPFENFPADGIGISAHKFYGPKGFGALYVRGNCKFTRLISGGEQERGKRGGTIFTAGAVGCAHALKLARSNAERDNKKVAGLRDTFLNAVLSSVEGAHLNGDGVRRLPSNANISFDGISGVALANALDLAGVCVSTGSACSSGAVKPSYVLQAMGYGEERASSAVRFTFGKDNTLEEVECVSRLVADTVAKLRGEK